jgi:ATP-dependent protease ClpP protease subunit
VFEARAIMTLLVEHPANITAKIDGVAASAGSVIALAADTVEIAEGGFYMIHKGWTFMMGNADDLRTTAGLLDKVDRAMIADYVAKSGKTAEQVETWMKAETWFSAEEAVEAGFADAVMPTTAAKKAKAQAKAFNLAAYANAPQALTEQTPDADEAAELLRAQQASRLGLYERTA